MHGCPKAAHIQRLYTNRGCAHEEFCHGKDSLLTVLLQLRMEGAELQASPSEARAEMLNIMGEPGLDLEASVLTPLNQSAETSSFPANCNSDSCCAAQMREEGVAPEQGSPAARAEMLNILEEMGYDSMATVLGNDEPSWWKQEEAARREAASSSAAASAEAAAQQRQDQRQMRAEADAEGKAFHVTFCASRPECLVHSMQKCQRAIVLISSCLRWGSCAPIVGPTGNAR